jgi:hypothetical protein
MRGKFRLSAQTGDYDMDHFIFDLGSDVNVLSKKTWEIMGKTKFIWFAIQLILVNQHKIVPIGWFLTVHANIDGVCSVSYLEFIAIVDDIQPYQALMGI